MGWGPSSLLLDTNLTLSSSSHVKYLNSRIYVRVFSALVPQNSVGGLLCICGLHSPLFYWPYIWVVKLLQLKSSKTAYVCYDTFRI